MVVVVRVVDKVIGYTIALYQFRTKAESESEK